MAASRKKKHMNDWEQRKQLLKRVALAVNYGASERTIAAMVSEARQKKPNKNGDLFPPSPEIRILTPVEASFVVIEKPKEIL